MTRLLIFCLLIPIISCENYTPKPNGYFRLDLPLKEYEIAELKCPFIFQYAKYAEINERKEDCWFNINYKFCNAKLHMSYKKINNNLNKHIENTNDLAYKHTKVAEGITEQAYQNTAKNLYGIVYDFQGNTATSMQFYLTDSIKHFVRGALYFETEINDSIIPINNFLKNDIYHLIESWEWKN